VNNGWEDEPNWGMCIYGNVTTRPLYNYHILIKWFFLNNQCVKGVSQVVEHLPDKFNP
jgi:hypothetical protein